MIVYPIQGLKIEKYQSVGRDLLTRQAGINAGSNVNNFLK
jgi:hypothetical protein